MKYLVDLFECAPFRIASYKIETELADPKVQVVVERLLTYNLPTGWDSMVIKDDFDNFSDALDFVEILREEVCG